MTEHPHECIYTPEQFDPEQNIFWGGKPCICEELRACEQRVLIAAREAVMQALGPMDCEDPDQYLTALAAIDALKEKP
jgi:hypothetical protein